MKAARQLNDLKISRKGTVNMVRIYKESGMTVCENNFYALEYSLTNGLFNLKEIRSGEYVIHNAYSRIVLEDDSSEFSTCSIGVKACNIEEYTYKTGDMGKRIAFIYEIDFAKYEVSFFMPEAAGYLLMEALLINSGDCEIRVSEIDVIRVDNSTAGPESFLKISQDPESCYVYTNTLYKTPSMVRRIVDGFDCGLLDKNSDISYFDRDMNPEWQAKYDGAIYDPVSRRSVVFGFLTYLRFMSEIRMKYIRNLSTGGIGFFALTNTCEPYILKPGSRLASETAYINFCDEVHEGQLHFAEAVGKVMGAKKLEYPPFGWCSWHSRFFDIDERSILDTAKFAVSRKDIFPIVQGGFEYIQIDYGWQKYLGSNEVDSARFPKGMKHVADSIHALGLKAGIWIAPFWIEEGCHLHETNPELLLHEESGSLVRMDRGLKDRPLYRLDVSNPGAVKLVISQLDQIINDWGYDMVKMDFLEMAVITPMDKDKRIRLYDTELTSYEHFRNACGAMQSYVDSLGRDIFLSPCGSPSMFLTGIFKSNYVAEDAVVKLEPDSWNEHAGVKSFARSWSTRYYLNNRVWTNNCESVILDRRRPYNEALVNATSAALTGGLYFTGDDLSLLPEDRLDIYSKLLPLYSKAAMPLDLYESINPATWKLQLEANGERWLVVGLFNLEDSEKDITISAHKLGLCEETEYLLFDFWEQRSIGSFKSSFTMLETPARSVKLICIREKRERPFVMSTDIHFTQGAVEFEKVEWCEESLSLEVKLKRYRSGLHRVFVHVPEGYSIINCHPEQDNLNVNDGIYEVKLYEGQKEFNLQFSISKGTADRM